MNRIQIWEVLLPLLIIREIARFEILHAPDSVYAELSQDQTKVFVAINSTGPRLCCVVGKLFLVSLSNPASVSTLIESSWVVFLEADRSSAYVGVTSPESTGARSVVRVDYGGRSRGIERR